MTGRSCRLRGGRGLIPNSAVGVSNVLTFITSARISLSLLEFLYRFVSHLCSPLVTDDALLPPTLRAPTASRSRIALPVISTIHLSRMMLCSPLRPVLLVDPGVSELLDCRKLFVLCSSSPLQLRNPGTLDKRKETELRKSRYKLGPWTLTMITVVPSVPDWSRLCQSECPKACHRQLRVDNIGSREIGERQG